MVPSSRDVSTVTSSAPVAPTVLVPSSLSDGLVSASNDPLHHHHHNSTMGLDHHDHHLLGTNHHDHNENDTVSPHNAALAISSSSSHGLEDTTTTNTTSGNQTTSNILHTEPTNQGTNESQQEQTLSTLVKSQVHDTVISSQSSRQGNNDPSHHEPLQQTMNGSSGEIQQQKDLSSENSNNHTKDVISTHPSTIPSNNDTHTVLSKFSPLQDRTFMGNDSHDHHMNHSAAVQPPQQQQQQQQQQVLYYGQGHAQTPIQSSPRSTSGQGTIPPPSGLSSSSSPPSRDASQGQVSSQQVQSTVSSQPQQHHFHQVPNAQQHPQQGGPVHPHHHSMPPSHHHYHHHPQHPMHNAPPQAGPPFAHNGQQQHHHHHPSHHPGMMAHRPPHYYSQHYPGMPNGHPIMSQGMPPGAAPLHSRMSSGNSVSSSSRNPSVKHGQYSPSHSNSNWQSDNDMKHRKEMIQRIVELLKKREGEASPEWLQKLPQMVKQLEVALYRSASSFEEYFDKTTLKQRLQALAKEISSKSNEDKSRSKRSSATATASKDQMIPPQNIPMSTMNGDNPPGPYNDSRYVNSTRQPDTIPSNSSYRSTEINTGSLSREQKERLRHKQERLLLLHHSSKCTKQDGTCTTPYCLDMKQLWTHMAKCENASCQIAHCYSSRTILSHYRKCKDHKCPVCTPVKSHIWREKNRGEQVPTQGHRSPAPTTPTSMSSSHAPITSQPLPSHPSHTHSHKNISQLPPSVTNNGSMPAPSSQFPSHPPYSYGSYPPPYGAVGANYSTPYSQIPTPSSNAPNNDNTVVTKPLQTSSSNVPPSVHPLKDKVALQDDPQSQMERIRHKQQRLLLLRHASKCDAPEGTCEVTQHCTEMKKLWHHISRCQKNDCDVLHCLSSRYVLIHYRKCKDAKCAACAPVRDAIKRGQQDKKRKLEVPSQQPVPQLSNISGVSPMPKRVKNEEVNLVPSLINSLTTEQIDTHVKMLNREFKLSAKELKDKCMKVLRILRDHEHGWVFNCPVDPVELGLPDYFDIIKNPMDLGTINKKLDKGEYSSIEAFDKDVRLTFDNAMLYNEMNSPVHTMAKTLLEIHSNLFREMVAEVKQEEEERRKNERACSLCGEEKRLFEPPVFFCSGMNCTNTRIRRQQFFYVSGHAQYNWCNSCYNELDDKLPIELPESQIFKRDLVKKKNNEEPEENWVACDDCERWVHQICGLFNARQNKDADVKYSCPKCLLKRRKAGTAKQTERLPGAADLPKTTFSEWLENHVNKKIKWKFENLALEKAQKESIPYEEAHKQITSVGKITIRQVTSTDRKLEVRERMLKRYEHKKYPDQFPFRCKCILVFQELDGVDVILFALYVYEHGEDNPPPNDRTIYISYLDSVHYMRPPKMRTFVYHEILIAYLDYARRRGFSSAHIWACPPMKGDDYIFFAKPPDQKTPRDAMLQKWYIDMLTESQKRGIVGKVTNMYDLYFKSEGADATSVPYLEGDYFSGEIENVIKDLEDGDKSAGSKDKEKKKKNIDKTKKMRKGTRSGGLDDDFITGDEGKNGGQDPVMVEIGKIIKPMKDSFIVAFLNWEGATPEHMQVGKEILLERERRKKEEPENVVSGNTLSKHTDSSITNEDPEKISQSKDEKDQEVKKSQIIDDDAEEMDCEILENRQAFLNLCRAPNHYQFDELRRSKHTSMMILWHLHNRDAAKFVPCCFSCSKEILTGIRYTCATCTDFDLCQECYRNPKTNRGSCSHKLIAKAVDGDTGQNPQLTEAQRRDRKNHIKLHIQLLEHASVCDSTKCNSANCKKMKQYLQHSKECKIKQQGGCKVCKRILTLLKYHAQSCKNTKCPIPQCRVIRERIRMMARQQQAMDDRRRQMMNQNFRGQPASG